MRWREAVLDPWKIPAYLAGIAVICFIIVVATKPEPEPICGTACQLNHIKMTLQRIERKVKDQAGRCEGANWRLPYIPTQRDI